jgi:hypothetical protein
MPSSFHMTWPARVSCVFPVLTDTLSLPPTKYPLSIFAPALFEMETDENLPRPAVPCLYLPVGTEYRAPYSECTQG